MDSLAVTVLGLSGLLIGSFLNVVIWRLPRGESLSRPRSACPRCGHPIRWWDNIPVASWVLLRGRCRDCGESISVRYPLVELATGVFFAIVVWWLPTASAADGSPAVPAATVMLLVAFLFLAGVSVVLTMIDLDTHTLPNRIVLPAYAVAAVLLAGAAVISGDWESLLRAAIGMTALFIAYLVIAFAYPGGAGMGLGDVKLAGVLGLFLGWLGWGSLIVGAFGAFVLGGIYSVALLALRRVNRKSGIPFGPWMLAGAWVGIFVGEYLWRAYLSLFGLA